MNKYLKVKVLSLLAVTILIGACKKEYDSVETFDDKAIQSYLSSNKLNFTKADKGYYYNIGEVGSGEAVENSDSVFYSYEFKTLTGQALNKSSNLAIPGTFLGYTDKFVIAGRPFLFTPIREVLTRLKRGGKATLILPSNLAFGKNGLTAINVGSNENILVNLGLYSQTKKHQIDEVELNAFEQQNTLTLTKDLSRARYKIITKGTGTTLISIGSTITANYVARTLDGTIVDQNSSGTFSASLIDLYKGWQIILPGKLTVGGKMRLVLPSDLANGSPLDFDIEIISIN